MRPRTVFAALGALVGVATAGYYEIAAPDTIAPGEPFDVILIGDLVNKMGFALAAGFGITEGEGLPLSLGPEFFGSFGLIPVCLSCLVFCPRWKLEGKN